MFSNCLHGFPSNDVQQYLDCEVDYLHSTDEREAIADSWSTNLISILTSYPVGSVSKQSQNGLDCLYRNGEEFHFIVDFQTSLDRTKFVLSFTAFQPRQRKKMEYF